jgi:hypothetical protein
MIAAAVSRWLLNWTKNCLLWLPIANHINDCHVKFQIWSRDHVKVIRGQSDEDSISLQTIT